MGQSNPAVKSKKSEAHLSPHPISTYDGVQEHENNVSDMTTLSRAFQQGRLAGAQRREFVTSYGQQYGNRQVQRMLASLNPGHSPNRAIVARSPKTAMATLPAWNKTELKAIQKQLRRLGFYGLAVDGLFGPGTESGLVEAFGGEQWHGFEPEIITEKLKAVETPKGKKGQHNLRYGEMFKDGILDMTLGIGYDEAHWNDKWIPGFQAALAERKFMADTAGAMKLYQQAGREPGAKPFGDFYVKRNALQYKPPAAEERQINAVVRLVYSQDGKQGKEAASAFQEGLVQSDATFYAGHGRYGSGPDFDRNFESFELLDKAGSVVEKLDNYEVLEEILKKEGAKVGRSAWQQFLWRDKNHRIIVHSSNEGNLYLNKTNKHSGEFGGNLINWSLKRNKAEGGRDPNSGKKGSLAEQTAEHPERKYRLAVFDGCSTKDYETSLRDTPGLNTRSTDMIMSQRVVYLHDYINTLVSYVDSILGQQSGEQIIKGMNDQQDKDAPEGKRAAFAGSGLGDNPVIK